ncbi:hypothetical protein MNBD_ALPHA01-1013 [hydrothermal vent metagenome]|uniref:ATP synthase F0 sector subunit b n=1 Tax=hydrothermal vent metagenome TaxID=652676 RepID=A0A3B0SPR8_9ZZZZ
MPQLDPAVFLPQIFWLFVLFGLVYLFIAHSAAPKITRVLERRQDRISSDLQEAEKLQAQAEEARITYEQALEEARRNATSMVATRRDAIKADMEAEYNKLTAQLSAEAEAAGVKITAAKDKALDEVRSISADVCQDIIRTVSGLSVDEKTVAEKLVTKFDEVKESANG